MAGKSKISILMPVRNAAPFLKECVDSILMQTHTDWELIAVDDGSTDDSVNILRKYATEESRLKILSNEGQGIVPALNLAFKASTGQFISRMDADDIMPERKLELLYVGLNEQPKTIATGKVRYFAENKVSEGYIRYQNWLNKLVEDGSYWNYIYRECVIASPNWLVHRSCFEEDIELSELEYPEDYDMTFAWRNRGYKIVGINEVTHLWREHPERISRKSARYQQKAFFDLKTEYFISEFAPFDRSVQLVGSGQKSVLVQRHFKQAPVPFEVFDVQESKKSVKSVDELTDELTILTNWPLNERSRVEIEKFLRDKGLFFGENLWLF